jgi:Mn2+/Fe2+ NRAMP family transporter
VLLIALLLNTLAMPVQVMPIKLSIIKKKKLIIASQRHERKFKSLLREHAILTGITDNPKDIITNLTADRH